MSRAPREPTPSPQSVARSIAARDWETAERQLRQLRRHFPDRADIPYNLALVLRESGRFDEALDTLAETAERFPDYRQAPFELANTLVALGRDREARDRLEQYLARWPGDADAHLLLGRIRLHHGDMDRAKDHLDALAPQIEAGDFDARLLAAQLHLRSGDLERALALFEQLSREAPDMRPGLLKDLTQAPRGRIPVDSRRLGWA